MDWGPTGFCIGPILFLVYINDLDDQLSSNVLKFADDSKLFRVVDNHLDGQRLQKDIDLLGEWAVQWQMKFNVVHYGKGNTGTKYSMYGQPIAEVSSERQ